MDLISKIRNPEPTLAGIPTLDRLSLMYEASQRHKDSEYESKDYKYCAKFEVGDEVICQTRFYYYAKVMAVYDKYVCRDLKKRIPCYRLKYKGWKHYDTEELQWVLEYDITGVHKFEKAGGSEILLAHYWNQKTLAALEVPPNPNVTVGLVQLSENEEAVYLKRWEDRFEEKVGSKMTFKQLMAIP